MNLTDLFPIADLSRELEAGNVRFQYHPDDPSLVILNYTDVCAYKGEWNDVTLNCRGLIVRVKYDAPLDSPAFCLRPKGGHLFDGDAVVIARPWPKFFNYEQPGAPTIPLDVIVEVTDKQDGSLGILYPAPDGGYAIATRGSFASEQALHATEVFQSKYDGWSPLTDITYLFEIVYPQNRIVLDYGRRDDLVLLGGVTEDGRTLGPGTLSKGSGWPGPVTPVFPASTLAEALAMEPRENAEGIVVRRHDTDEMVKVKQADYVALHRIITNTSNLRIWEHIAVEACKKIIEKPLHWGTYLHLDPARAEECMAAGDDWLDKMLAGVPDEFFAWVHHTIAQIENDVLLERLRIKKVVHDLTGVPRKEAFAQLTDDAAQQVIMAILFGADELAAAASVTRYAWDTARPPANELPFARSEAVA